MNRSTPRPSLIFVFSSPRHRPKSHPRVFTMSSPRRSTAAERLRDRLVDEVEDESLGLSGMTFVEMPPHVLSGSPSSRRIGARSSPASSVARPPASRRGAAAGPRGASASSMGSTAPSISTSRRVARASATTSRSGPPRRTGGTSFPSSRAVGRSTARFASGGTMASTFRSRLPGVGPPSTRSLPAGGVGGGGPVRVCSHGRASARF